MSEDQIFFTVFFLVVYYLVFLLTFVGPGFEGFRKKFFSECGVWGVPYFCIPFFPLIYHFVVVPGRVHLKTFGNSLNEYNARISRRNEAERKNKLITKLLDEDDEVEIFKIDISNKTYLCPATLITTDVKIVRLTYKFVNTILDSHYGIKTVVGNGNLADMLEPNAHKTIYMKYSALRLMILNNKLDNLMANAIT